MGPYYDHSVSIALGLDLQASTPRSGGLPPVSWAAAAAYAALAWAWIKPQDAGLPLSPTELDGRWRLESLRHEWPDKVENLLH